MNLSDVSRADVNIRTILLATDGSAPAIIATQYAVAIARIFNARLKAIFVDSNDDNHAYGDGIVGRDSLKEIRPSAAGLDVVQYYATRNGVNFEAAVVYGNTAQTIIDTAENCEADLIIVGNTGRTGLRRLALGSVAEEVVKASRIPVLVLKDN